MLEFMPEGHRRVWVNARAWSTTMSALPEVRVNFEALAGGIRRDEMIGIVDRAVRAKRWADAFVVTMMWGYGRAGYGPYRTRLVLEQSDAVASRGTVAPRTIAALESGAALGSETLEDAARKGFWHYNNTKSDKESGVAGANLKNFGPAFFTKWLSAVSANGDPNSPKALPILDAVIEGWWQANVEAGFNARKTDDYVAYVTQLAKWRDVLRHDYPDLSLIRIEEAIFETVQRGPAGADTVIDLDSALLP